jgi:hypothetical protein
LASLKQTTLKKHANPLRETIENAVHEMDTQLVQIAAEMNERNYMIIWKPMTFFQ